MFVVAAERADVLDVVDFVAAAVVFDFVVVDRTVVVDAVRDVESADVFVAVVDVERAVEFVVVASVEDVAVFLVIVVAAVE